MSLPLPKSELPESIRRFGDPSAPTPAKMMAAKGLLPVRGDDLVSLLVQLAADPDATVASTAKTTLASLPESALEGACRAPLHPAILDALATHLEAQPELLGELVGNRATPDETIIRIARTADELTTERIATDQERLLATPAIIEALYKNTNTRMSTVDRLVELAARNGVELEGVHTFQAHVEAIRGELIVDEPQDEPLPVDLDFQSALSQDGDDEPIETDAVDGTESVKESHKPLAQLLAEMSVPNKLRMCLIGSAAARSILVRDPNKMVALAAVGSPAMSEAEAARIAMSRQVDDSILREIANRREWLGNYEVKRALIFNPKTPAGVSMRFLSHLRLHDLRALARSKNVPAALRTTAKQRLEQRDGRKA